MDEQHIDEILVCKVKKSIRKKCIRNVLSSSNNERNVLKKLQKLKKEEDKKKENTLRILMKMFNPSL